MRARCTSARMAFLGPRGRRGTRTAMASAVGRGRGAPVVALRGYFRAIARIIDPRLGALLRA